MTPSLAALVLCIAAQMSPELPPELSGALADADVTAHRVVDVEPAQQRAHVLAVPVLLEGERYTLELLPQTVRAPSFRVRIDAGDGRLTDVTPPAPATYVGTLLESPGSTASASVVEGELRAIVRFPDNTIWTIQPADDFAPGAPGAPSHVLYTGADLAPVEGACEVIEPREAAPVNDAQPKAATRATPLAVQRGGTTIFEATLAWDIDWQAYQQLGSSVAACIAEVERITNDVNVVYERDVAITHAITDIIVRTSSAANPYTTNTTSTFLDQVSDEWNVAPLNAIERDLLHVLTGRNIVNDEGNANTIGVAYLNTACRQDAGIGISENRSSVLQEAGLVAHELGHNWSARHCNGDADCRIMCSGIGGCDGINPLQFEAGPIASITNKRDSVACLDEVTTNDCLADFDNNGQVDLTDFGAFGTEFGRGLPGGGPACTPSNPCQADLDNNGQVDLTDFGAFGTEFGRGLPGGGPGC